MDCCVAKYDKCVSKFQQLYDKLTTVIDENDIESVAWQSSGHTSLENYVKSEDKFANLVIAKLKKMHLHDFVSQQQAEFLKCLKQKNLDGKVVVIVDFALKLYFYFSKCC